MDEEDGVSGWYVLVSLSNLSIVRHHANAHAVDEFSLKQGYAAELATSLIKLQIQNLSAMDADWMYSTYNYSHPILTERLKAIGWTSDRKVGNYEEKKGVNGDAGHKEL